MACRTAKGIALQSPCHCTPQGTLNPTSSLHTWGKTRQSSSVLCTICIAKLVGGRITCMWQLLKDPCKNHVCLYNSSWSSLGLCIDYSIELCFFFFSRPTHFFLCNLFFCQRATAVRHFSYLEKGTQWFWLVWTPSEGFPEPGSC